MLMTKKTTEKRGLSIYDGAGSTISNFAKRQMEKMGYVEGQGLGKSNQGLTKHIKAVKKDDNAGLGIQEKSYEEAPENWWHDAFSKQLQTFTSKKKKKNKLNDAVVEAPPTYDELFAATGGARLGMRARASQKGKIMRTEGGTSTVLPTDKVEPDDCIISNKTEKKKKKRDITNITDSVPDDSITCNKTEKKKKNREISSITDSVNDDEDQSYSDLHVNNSDIEDIIETDINRKKRKVKRREEKNTNREV